MKQLSLFQEYGPKSKKEIQRPDRLLDDYDTVIVSHSAGIDSMGALAWALKHFPKEKVLLLYCDTDLEPYESWPHLLKIHKHLGLRRPVVLCHPDGFFGILEKRKMWPNQKNRWCTAYLKTMVTESWIRQNRNVLGTRVLFPSGERRDDSPRRAKLPNLAYHPTHLKTKRVGDFTCHWHRPVLDNLKGEMFELSKKLGIPPHPCYSELPRCSCLACIFARNADINKNMIRYPEAMKRLVAAELRIGHTWKRDMSLNQLWNEVCEEGADEKLIV
ncbi:MAG: phosphoadenosine phosphosulfate reductase domain-containing protein [Eubacteriales bacterium]